MEVYHILKKSAFLDNTIIIFNRLPFKNKYCIVDSYNTKDSQISFYNNFADLVNEINDKASIVIIHSVFFKLEKISKITKPIVWCTWGYDIYSSKEYRRQRLITIQKYKKESENYLRKPVVYLRRVLTIIKDLILQNNTQRQWNDFYKQVTAIAPVIKNEYDLIKNQNPGFAFKYFYFKYLDLEEQASELLNYSPGILLGNSATIENNHLDIIKILNKRKIDTKVCIPISYGDKMYKDFLRKNVNNENITFLENYMPKDQYYNYINNYGNVIIGCLRQQAMGNIYRALKTGKRVFLFKDSIMYDFLKSEGYIVFSIDEDLSQELIQTKFKMNDAEYNRTLYMKKNSSEELINKLKQQLVSIVEK